MVMIEYIRLGLKMMHAKDQVCLMFPGAVYQCNKILPRVAGVKYDLHHPVLINRKGRLIESRNIKPLDQHNEKRYIFYAFQRMAPIFVNIG